MTQIHFGNDRRRSKAVLRPCVMCGFPMFLSVIEPSDKSGQDWRTFVCVACHHTETVTVTYAES